MSSSVSTVKSNTKMPVAKKSAPAPAAPATPVVAADPTNVTPAKRLRKEAPAKVEQAPVVVVTPAPAVVVAADAAPTRTSSAIIADLQDRLRELNSEFTTRVRSLISEVQEATKAIKRDARASKRRTRVDPATLSPEERVRYDARRAKNAFLKQRPISDELCAFMGLPAASQRSQIEVTKYISTYVKEHTCFDPSFKRNIIPDAKLAKILRAKDSDKVTYLNLQTFLKVHFLKPAVVA